MRTFRRLLLISLIAAMALALASCGSNKQLTMYVGLGNNGTGYYTKLKEAVKENTGIDLKFVYSSTMDVSNAMVIMLENEDPPADIVVTAAKIDNAVCEKSLLDLASYTNATDCYSVPKLESLADEGGAIYQLPYTSRLIGIEYNETLLKELGWTLPSNFQEMKELKAKADAAGIKFAVSGGAATGHGFNYLFHTMGAQYLTSLKGTEWLAKYQQGAVTIDDFASESAYFKKYADAGLFGKIHSEDWAVAQEFSQTRALFYYNYINDISKYDGYRYNEDGTITGASYDSSGQVIAKRSLSGEAVLIDGKYVLYDANNKAHNGLDRYTIPGAVILHDTYGSMPWLSEDGSSNYFTMYDNMYLGLSKELLKDKGKLDSAEKVLEFMASKKAMDIFSNMYADGFVSTTNYVIDESRMYYEYADEIKKGYTMPWYYNSFDADTVVNVGQKVNEYLQGKSGFDAVLTELDKQNVAYVNGKVEVIGEIEKDLTFPLTATLEAEASILSAQAALDNLRIDKKVGIAILPYMERMGDMEQEVSLPVVQSKFYAGKVEAAKLSSYVNTGTNQLVILEMKGEEVKKLIVKGYNALEDYGIDKTFHYERIVKSGGGIQSDKTYCVVVPKASIESSKFAEFEQAGYVVKKNGQPVTATIVDGLKLYFTK